MGEIKRKILFRNKISNQPKSFINFNPDLIVLSVTLSSSKMKLLSPNFDGHDW